MLMACYEKISTLGFMLQPAIALPRARLTELNCWAADNGCFSKGELFDLSKFYAWLDKVKYAQSNCLFAVAPDVLSNARATIERSTPVLIYLRKEGWKAAFVAQDGQELFDPDWDSFDCLFIGGSTEFKLGASAARLIQEAKEHEKWVHIGRVNSASRGHYFSRLGEDSADGT